MLSLGEPVEVDAARGRKEASAALTRLLEERVQSLLDGITAPPGRAFDRPGAPDVHRGSG